MAIKKSQVKAVKKYEDNNYFKVLVRFPSDQESELKELAEKLNCTVPALIKQCVNNYIENTPRNAHDDEVEAKIEETVNCIPKEEKPLKRPNRI